MIGRIVGVLGLAAVLAAGPALASPLAVSSAAVSSAVTKPGYVGIVISGHGAYCVKWTKGITGDTVLNKVARVTYSTSGLIQEIDGAPSSGRVDDTHYWSYWHDTKASWTYSNVGASGYDPKAGTVEGWSYDNGKSDAPPPSQNPSGLYTTMCGKDDSAAGGRGGGSATASPRTTPARPSHRSTSATSAHPTAARHHRARASTASAPSTGTSTRPVTPTASSGPSPSGSHAHRNATAAPRSAAATGATSGPAVVVVRGSVAPSAAADRSSASSGSPVGLILGIGLVVVLSAGAGAFALRRRGAGG